MLKFNDNMLKCIKDIEKLCMVENFILSNGTEPDTEILKILESLMEEYAYGWYICEDKLTEQLKSINRFKIHILDLIENY